MVVGVSMQLGTSTSSPSLPSLLAHLAQERDTQVRIFGYLTEICFHVSNPQTLCPSDFCHAEDPSLEMMLVTRTSDSVTRSADFVKM